MTDPFEITIPAGHHNGKARVSIEPLTNPSRVELAVDEDAGGIGDGFTITHMTVDQAREAAWALLKAAASLSWKDEIE